MCWFLYSRLHYVYWCSRYIMEAALPPMGIIVSVVGQPDGKSGFPSICLSVDSPSDPSGAHQADSQPIGLVVIQMPSEATSYSDQI
jgi:hypothetical protein